METSTTPYSDYKQTPVRCPSGDPNACKRCGEFLAIPGYDYCPIHSAGAGGELDLARRGIYNFKKGEILRRMQVFKNNPESRSLASEIALLRILLEDTINKCGDDQYDLIMSEGPIVRIINSIRETLTANQKIEERVGELLSIEQVIEIIKMIYNMVGDYIKNPNQMQELADRINILIQGGPIPTDAEVYDTTPSASTSNNTPTQDTTSDQDNEEDEDQDHEEDESAPSHETLDRPIQESPASETLP